MDPNKMGLWIGAIALFLAVPLSVAANLLTPYVRNWWASTSQSRRLRRIRQIEAQLTEVQNSWYFSDSEWEIFTFLRNSAATALVLFQAAFGFGLDVLSIHWKTIHLDESTLPHNLYYRLLFLAIYVVAVGTVAIFFVLPSKYSERSKKGYGKLHNELIKLHETAGTHDAISQEMTRRLARWPGDREP